MKLNLNMYPDGKLNLVVGTTTAPGVWVKDKSGSVAVRSQSKKGFQFEGDLKRASNNKADFRLNKYHVSLTRVSAVAPKPIPIVRSKTPYKAKPKAKPAPVAKTAVKPTVKLTVEPKASPKQDPSLKRSYHLNSVSE